MENSKDIPEYMKQFLNNRHQELEELLHDNYSKKKGILNILFDEKNNNVDVFYVDIDMIKENNTKILENIEKQNESLKDVDDKKKIEETKLQEQVNLVENNICMKIYDKNNHISFIMKF
jgi:hypothetical protein